MIFQWPLSPTGTFQLVKSLPLKSDVKPSGAAWNWWDSVKIHEKKAGSHRLFCWEFRSGYTHLTEFF